MKKHIRLLSLVMAILFSHTAQGYLPGNTYKAGTSLYRSYSNDEYTTIENVNNKYYGVKEGKPTDGKTVLFASAQWPENTKYAACILRELLSPVEWQELKHIKDTSLWFEIFVDVRADWKGNVVDVVFRLPQKVDKTDKIVTPHKLALWEKRIKEECKYPILPSFKNYTFLLWKAQAIDIWLDCDKNPKPFLDKFYEGVMRDDFLAIPSNSPFPYSW